MQWRIPVGGAETESGVPLTHGIHPGAAALMAAQEVIGQFEIPGQVELRFKGLRRVSGRGQHGMTDGTVSIVGMAKTMSGIRVHFDIPMIVKNGRLLEPATIIHEGALRVLAQSTFDDILGRGTFSRPNLCRNTMYSPPPERAEEDEMRQKPWETMVRGTIFDIVPKRASKAELIKAAVHGTRIAQTTYPSDVVHNAPTQRPWNPDKVRTQQPTQNDRPPLGSEPMVPELATPEPVMCSQCKLRFEAPYGRGQAQCPRCKSRHVSHRTAGDVIDFDKAKGDLPRRAPEPEKKWDIAPDRPKMPAKQRALDTHMKTLPRADIDQPSQLPGEDTSHVTPLQLQHGDVYVTSSNVAVSKMGPGGGAQRLPAGVTFEVTGVKDLGDTKLVAIKADGQVWYTYESDLLGHIRQAAVSQPSGYEAWVQQNKRAVEQAAMQFVHQGMDHGQAWREGVKQLRGQQGLDVPPDRMIPFPGAAHTVTSRHADVEPACAEVQEAEREESLHAGTRKRTTRKLDVKDRGGATYTLTKGTRVTVLKDMGQDGRAYLVTDADGTRFVVPGDALGVC